MPRCIGQYELGHALCDGGPGRVACNHRSTCIALQAHTAKKGTKPTDYVILDKDVNGNIYAKPLGIERFVKIVEKQKVFAVEEKVIVVRSIHLRKKKKKGYKDTKKKESPWHGNFVLLNDWFEEWLAMIVKGTGLPLARLAVEARAGELYFRDRRRNARSEIALYIRGKSKGLQHGIDFPIAEFCWQTKKLKATVTYCILPEQFVGITIQRMRWLKPKKTELEDKKKRHFRSRSVDLTRAQVRMSAEVIVDLMNWNLIKSKEFLESVT